MILLSLIWLALINLSGGILIGLCLTREGEYKIRKLLRAINPRKRHRIKCYLDEAKYLPDYEVSEKK